MGVLPAASGLWETRRRGADARVALNARLLDHTLIADVPVSVLDGDKTWRVVERYRLPAMYISPSRKNEVRGR
jgi:hypothetical protein